MKCRPSPKDVKHLQPAAALIERGGFGLFIVLSFLYG